MILVEEMSRGRGRREGKEGGGKRAWGRGSRRSRELDKEGRERGGRLKGKGRALG